jgi:hypothetical protein
VWVMVFDVGDGVRDHTLSGRGVNTIGELHCMRNEMKQLIIEGGKCQQHK